MGLLDTPFELGHPLKVRSKCLELSLDAETDEKLEEPYAAGAALRQRLEPEEGTYSRVRPSLVLDQDADEPGEGRYSRVRPRFGLDQDLIDLPAVVRGNLLVDCEPPASAPHDSQQQTTAHSNSPPAGFELLLGPRSLRAAYSGGEKPVDCGPPSAPCSHKPTVAGLDGKPVDCEPQSGPCVQSGHVAERWRLELDEELDDEYADGWRKQADCERPADPHLLQVVDGRPRAGCEEEATEWPAGVGRWVRFDDELDEYSVGRRRRRIEWVLLVSLGRHELAPSSVD